MSPFSGWWWLEHFFIFPYIGYHHPHWLIFFRWVGQPPTSFGLDCDHDYQGSSVHLCLDMGRRLLVISNAFHMARTMEIFRKAGITSRWIIDKTWFPDGFPDMSHFRYLISLHSSIASTVCSWNWCNMMQRFLAFSYFTLDKKCYIGGSKTIRHKR